MQTTHAFKLFQWTHVDEATSLCCDCDLYTDDAVKRHFSSQVVWSGLVSGAVCLHMLPLRPDWSSPLSRDPIPSLSGVTRHTVFRHTGCLVTLCQYFTIMFLRSFPVRNAIWTEVRLKIRAFWDITPCSLVGVGRRFRGVYCLHPHPDDGDSKHFWNVEA
jgi:hypothetical protein